MVTFHFNPDQSHNLDIFNAMVTKFPTLFPAGTFPLSKSTQCEWILWRILKLHSHLWPTLMHRTGFDDNDDECDVYDGDYHVHNDCHLNLPLT